MQTDTDRWNSKYSKGNPNPEFIADSTLIEFQDLFSGPGRALDLACGVGHNALWLAKRRFYVDAIDISETGLGYLQQAANTASCSVNVIAADLNRYTLKNNTYDAIVVIRYLNRNIFTNIVDALVPGGVLLFKTFNQNFLKENQNFNPDYVLKHGELDEVFSTMRVISKNDALSSGAHYDFWLGRKV